jgi:hypothetical protein
MVLRPPAGAFLLLLLLLLLRMIAADMCPKSRDYDIIVA